MSGIALVSAGKWLAGVAGDKALDIAVDYVQERIVAPLRERRAKRFLNELLDELSREQDENAESATLNDLLNKIGAGDKQASLVFESYRRVALCASKEIGPMIIGILTGVILNGTCIASEGDEQIFMAAEMLNDRDFSDFVAWYEESHKLYNKPSHPNLKPPSIAGAPMVAEVFSKATSGRFTDGDMPVNLFADVGTFATKLSNLGLLMPFSRKMASAKNPDVAKHYIATTSGSIRLLALARRALEAQKVKPSV